MTQICGRYYLFFSQLAILRTISWKTNSVCYPWITNDKHWHFTSDYLHVLLTNQVGRRKIPSISHDSQSVWAPWILRLSQLFLPNKVLAWRLRKKNIIFYNIKKIVGMAKDSFRKTLKIEASKALDFTGSLEAYRLLRTWNNNLLLDNIRCIEL